MIIEATPILRDLRVRGRGVLLRSVFFQYNMYKRHDNHSSADKQIYIYRYGGTKTILGLARALRVRAGKTIQQRYISKHFNLEHHSIANLNVQVIDSIPTICSDDLGKVEQ